MIDQIVRAVPKPTKQKKKRNQIGREKVRQQVIDRDGNWCLLCGRPGPGLHLHRVKYGSEGGKYEKENCVLLCTWHHNPVVHSNKKKWQPILLNYLQSGAKQWIS